MQNSIQKHQMDWAYLRMHVKLLLENYCMKMQWGDRTSRKQLWKITWRAAACLPAIWSPKTCRSLQGKPTKRMKSLWLRNWSRNIVLHWRNFNSSPNSCVIQKSQAKRKWTLLSLPMESISIKNPSMLLPKTQKKLPSWKKCHSKTSRISSENSDFYCTWKTMIVSSPIDRSLWPMRHMNSSRNMEST